jgi:hypothetical protein
MNTRLSTPPLMNNDSAQSRERSDGLFLAIAASPSAGGECIGHRPPEGVRYESDNYYVLGIGSANIKVLP